MTCQTRPEIFLRQDSVLIVMDSMGLKGFSYFHPQEKDVVFHMNDTTIHHPFTRFDPSKLFGNEHIHLGNTFSPASPLLFDPLINITFNHGYNQYDVYRHRPEKARFYTSSKPQSDVFFSQFSNQLNFSAGARVSIPFQKGFSFSIDYFRVSEQGFYLSHAVKSTNFTIGLNYTAKRYNLTTYLVQHAQDEENNGGILNVSDVNTSTPSRAVVTNINQAKTRHQERTFAVSQYLTLAGTSKWKLYAQNNLLYTPSYYKFSHLTQINDTAYYGKNFIDQRGLRRFLEIDHSQADFYLGGQDSSGLNGKIGLLYDFYHINDAGFTRKRSDLTAVFKGNIPFLKVLVLQAYGALGLAENAGNFKAEGKLNLKLKKWADLYVGSSIFLSEASFASQNLVVNGIQLLNNNWQKSFGTTFYGELNIPFSNTGISAIQTIMTNPVFWRLAPSATGLSEIESVQSETLLSYTSLRVRQNLKLKNFHFNNGLFFQFFSENLYHLPTWYSSHQLYWDFRIFRKALLISAGVEARIIPEYEGIGYSVLHGQFFADNTTRLPLFPEMDLVLNARVKNFRVSFMIENAGQWFQPDQNFNVKDYPLMDPLLRFSVRWMFFN